METRDRLIELIRNADNDKNLGWYDLYDLTHEKGGCAGYFADYLLANGVIVPPCNIDDVIYYPWIYGDTSGIALLEVSHIKIYVQGRCLVFYNYAESDMPMPACFSVEDFGKTVFLTKEEAEAKLKEMKGNG